MSTVISQRQTTNSTQDTNNSNSRRAAPDIFTWKDIRVTTKKTKKLAAFEIVKGVSGFSVGGTATGIMGPSGCGKTSLLNILALGKHSENTVTTGTISWNNSVISRAKLGKFVGYVHQEDALLGVFTARELFTFSANLRLPFTTHANRSSTIAQRVSRVLRQLHMEAVADRVVGDDKGRGLSGGERRRVSIGVELVTSPKVLILDEPTSGLDSHIAKAVVNTLMEVTRENNICLLFTIHQPSSSMFRQLHRLVLMAKGEMAYFGPPLDVLTHFSNISPVMKCPELTNPAEHILDIITGSIVEESHNPHDNTNTHTITITSTSAPNPLSVEGLILQWRNSHSNSEKGLDEMMQQTLQSHPHNNNNNTGTNNNNNNNKHVTSSDGEEYCTGGRCVAGGGRMISATSTTNLLSSVSNSGSKSVPGWYCFLIVLQREWRNFIRDPYYFGTQIVTNLFISVFVGFMFYKTHNFTDRASAIYFALLNVCFVPCMSVMVRFPLARKVFNREKEAGYYGTASFFWAYFCVDIPSQLVMTLSFSLPVYWMVGFYNTFGHFILFNVWLYLMYQVSQSLGLACTTAFPTVTGSMAVGSLLLIVFMSFGGFFLDLGSIPVWFEWISYISLFRYSFEGLVVSELHDREGGRAFYEAMGMKSQVWTDALALIAMIAFFRILTYISLRFFRGNTKM